MRIALVIGANPREFEGGANVPIPVGKWRVIYDNVRDSAFAFHSHNGSLLPFEDGLLVVKDATPVRVQLLTKGSEEFFNVFLEAA